MAVTSNSPPAMYLEGSDQHRGWFHSSLLESCATNGFAPYKSVLTHGFTLDGEGKKMSKSLGNTVAPQDVIKQYGAEILRLWVASSDYADDQRIGKEIINSTVDSYRKLRNTMRWLLGNLAHYKSDEKVAFADMPELERLILNRLSELDAQVREAYTSYDYKRIIAALSNFMNVELSAFYFDIRKDALYCDPISSARRKACSDRARRGVRLPDGLARAGAGVHHGGVLAGTAFRRNRVRAPAAVPGGAQGMGRRRALGASGRHQERSAATSPRSSKLLAAKN